MFMKIVRGIASCTMLFGAGVMFFARPDMFIHGVALFALSALTLVLARQY